MIRFSPCLRASVVGLAFKTTATNSQIGKKSGLDSIDLKCKELGLTIRPEQRNPLLAAVKQAAVRKGGLVSDEEFRQILASLRVPA